MKILLIRPKPHKETIGLQHVMICEPLELEYIVSNIDEDIKDKIKIKIIDLILEKKKYIEIIRRENPDFILYTGYITHVGIIKELSRKSKGILPNVKTGVGGIHAEVLSEDFSSSYIDFIYSKNGIDGFNTTIKALIKGDSDEYIREMLSNIGPKKDYFSYKHPDRDSVSYYRKKYYYMFHNPCALIKTSFGCPYNCSFCFCREITDKKYFTREIQDVMDELESIHEEEIYIVDDDFLYDEVRLNAFIREIKIRGINKKFLVYGRADFIASNLQLLRNLKSIGLQSVIVGIESLRGKDLKEYNKKTTKNINEECINILKKLNIELYATLIIPLDFTLEDFKEMTNWLRDLNIRFVNLQPLTPLPGTTMFDKYSSELIVKREDYYMWDMAHVVLRPENMSIRKFYLELLTAYYKIVMRPKHMIALIKKYGIKSNFKMLIGSSLVSFQYIKKIIRGY
ncbi:MAG: cobalamin-dependent protein [Eubacteriales bacterium]